MTEYIKKETAIQTLKHCMPTIDIVYCTECKHYEEYTENTGFCNLLIVDSKRLACEYCFFCADGVRKGGEY